MMKNIILINYCVHIEEKVFLGCERCQKSDKLATIVALRKVSSITIF